MRKIRRILLISILILNFILLNQSIASAETPTDAGTSNNALYFGSRSDNLIMSPGVNVGTQAFTFESYFKTGPKIDYGFFIGVAGGNGISINIHSEDEIQVDAYGIGATVFILASPLEVNTWHHIAVSRDSNNDETVWVDGIRATSSKNRWSSDTYGAVYNDIRNYSGASSGINVSTACAHCNDGLGNAATNDFAEVKIANYRFVVGNTVYDPNQATISLPSTPLANVANTKVLLNVTNEAGLLTDSSGTQTLSNNSVAFSAREAGVPSAPTALSAAAGDGKATISFTAGSDRGSAITNYKYSLDGITYAPLSPSVTISPLIITGLTNGTTYNIYLKAVNAIGDGVASSSVTVTPLAPVTASPLPTSVETTDTTVVTTVSSKKSRGKTVINWTQKGELVLTTYNKTTKKSSTKKLIGGLAKIAHPKPGQSAVFTLTNSQGAVVKKFRVNSRPLPSKQVNALFTSSSLNATWAKAVGAKKYRVTITPQIGKPIVLITTDSKISIDLENSASATLTIVAVGSNGLTSKPIIKTISTAS